MTAEEGELVMNSNLKRRGLTLALWYCVSHTNTDHKQVVRNQLSLKDLTLRMEVIKEDEQSKMDLLNVSTSCLN